MLETTISFSEIVMINSFHFDFFLNAFIFIFEGYFIWYSFLNWQFLSFRSLKIFHVPLASMISWLKKIQYCISVTNVSFKTIHLLSLGAMIFFCLLLSSFYYDGFVCVVFFISILSGFLNLPEFVTQFLLFLRQVLSTVFK